MSSIVNKITKAFQQDFKLINVPITDTIYVQCCMLNHFDDIWIKRHIDYTNNAMILSTLGLWTLSRVTVNFVELTENKTSPVYKEFHIDLDDSSKDESGKPKPFYLWSADVRDRCGNSVAQFLETIPPVILQSMYETYSLETTRKINDFSIAGMESEEDKKLAKEEKPIEQPRVAATKKQKTKPEAEAEAEAEKPETPNEPTTEESDEAWSG